MNGYPSTAALPIVVPDTPTPEIEYSSPWLRSSATNSRHFQIAQDAKSRATCEVCGDPIGLDGSISINWVRSAAYNARCPLHPNRATRSTTTRSPSTPRLDAARRRQRLRELEANRGRSAAVPAPTPRRDAARRRLRELELSIRT